MVVVVRLLTNEQHQCAPEHSLRRSHSGRCEGFHGTRAKHRPSKQVHKSSREQEAITEKMAVIRDEIR